MKKRRIGFTLVELLVVISIIALLLAVLMPALENARKQARLIVCQSNLRQWGISFRMYCNDNNGYFFSGLVNGQEAGWGEYWRVTMKPYTQNEKMWLCPEATDPVWTSDMAGQPPSKAWKHGDDIGSYGLNGYVLNPPSNRNMIYGRPVSNYWRTPSTVEHPDTVPMFTDMWYYDAWPRAIDQPPATENAPPDRLRTNEMSRVCVNRHDGFINSVFMDNSVRKVGLKELWTLKWHRSYDTDGPWTEEGGISPGDWPQWMRRFENY